MKLNALLRRRMNDYGMDARSLAAAAGLHYDVVVGVLRGEHAMIGIDTCRALCRALDISPAVFDAAMRESRIEAVRSVMAAGWLGDAGTKEKTK